MKEDSEMVDKMSKISASTFNVNKSIWASIY